MRRWALAIVGAVLAFPGGAAAQDPTWEVIRPNVTWDNHWRVEPRPRALPSVLDEPTYHDQVPGVSGDRALATRPRQRFAIGFEDPAAESGRLAGGEAWVYIGIRKHTRVDLALRTRREGRVVSISSLPRQTPPISLAPENPPVGRNGFRGWLPITVPALTPDEANRLSLSVRISPSSRRESLSRVYATFVELYPG